MTYAYVTVHGAIQPTPPKVDGYEVWRVGLYQGQAFWVLRRKLA